jgi:hypothetical protein
VTHEDRVPGVELGADLEHVGGVAVQGRVPLGPVGAEIRPAGPHVVEEHDAVRVGERRRDEPPHVLVAAEPVGKDHRRPVRSAGQVDVVPH